MRPALQPWKESVLLDPLATWAGPRPGRLLARADVLTVNASEQQLGRLGLSGTDLATLAPRSRAVSPRRMERPERRPRGSQRSGYDDLVQAATGIMARFGGGLETPEEHAHFGTIDVLAGLAAAAATAFALYAREATGKVHGRPLARSPRPASSSKPHTCVDHERRT